MSFPHEGFSLASYSGFGPYASHFEVDSVTGEVRLGANTPLTAPDGTRFTNLTLQVSFFGMDGDGNVVTARTAPGPVTVTPVDHAPVITVSSRLDGIDEHADEGTVIATFDATDRNGDAVRLELDGTHADLFEIIESDGVKSVVLRHPDRLDYETLGADRTVSVRIVATSQADGGAPQSTSRQFTLRVNDVDEDVAFAREIFTWRVDENVAGAELVILEAVDPDGDVVSFEPTGPNAGLFVITEDNRIRLKDGVSLDHEALEQGYIDVGVTARAVHTFADGRTSQTSDTAVVRVHVNNLPEMPTVTVTMLQDAIAEHAAVGTPVARIAIDPHGQNITVGLGGAHAGLFEMRGDTIVIVDRDGFNHETLRNGIDLKIIVTPDEAATIDGLVAEVPVPVRIGDIDDPVRFVRKAAAFTLAENAAVGTELGDEGDVFIAVDPDGDPVRYTVTLADGGDAPFIRTADGRLAVAEGAEIDFEALAASGGKIVVTVTAISTHTNEDGTKTETRDSTLATVTVSDVDEAPVFMGGTLGKTLDEFGDPLASDLLLTTLSITDPDGDRPVISHKVGGDPRLKLVGNKLYLKAGSTLDHEGDNGAITAEILAWSVGGSGAARHARTTYTLTIGDVDEPQIFDLTAGHDQISQQNLPAILAVATRVNGFEGNLDTLRFGAGVTEVWHRRVDDGDAAGGRSTLITAFNGTTNAEVHYAVLTGWTGRLTSAHLQDDDILIRTSKIGRDDHGGSREWLSGTSGTGHIDGGDGLDRLYGRDGDDRLYGGDGYDWLYGGDGDDWLYGGDGDDGLYGHAGDDRLHGGDGNDRLYGHDGDDRLHGGDGDDWLQGGSGRDILTGGAGRDRFTFYDTATSLSRADVVTDFTKSEDKIYMGFGMEEIWVKIQDADGDGDNDTVLYNNAEDEGGIHAILRDYSGTLTASDFVNWNGNAIDDFTVNTIPEIA